MRQARIALLLCVTLAAALVAGCAKATPTPEGITITGTVQTASPVARLIVLAEAVDGYANVVLAPDARVLTADGADVALADIRAGQIIRATGQAGGADALVASIVVVMEGGAAPAETAQPPATAAASPAPTVASTAAPTLTPSPTPHEIRLDAPLEGAEITSPVTVRGWVSIAPFESTLLVRVRGAGDQVLIEAPVMVGAEMGQPGEFEAQITFPAPAGGSGALEVLELSPRDGSIIARAAVNVTFPGAAEATASGTIALVYASARVVTLAEPVDGITFIALTDQTAITTQAGAAGSFEDLQTGISIQAIGSPIGSDTLLASRVVLLGTGPAREIQLTAPAEGATIVSPVEVSGSVSVSPFESTLVVRIYDAEQQLLVTAPVMVDAEMGQPGGFAGQVSFGGPTSGAGVLEVVDLSPEDGSVLARAAVNIIFAAGEEFRVAGTVSQVLTSAGVISLSQPVEGIAVIAWTETTAILAADGSATTLQAIVPGVQIEATGNPDSGGVLVATIIRLR